MVSGTGCSSVDVAGTVVVVPGCSAAGVVCGGSVDAGEVDVEETPGCFPEGSGIKVLGNRVWVEGLWFGVYGVGSGICG